MGKYPKPNKAEAERIERMLRLGCCYCAELCLWMTAEVHHIVEGNKRLGHWYTLPCCPGHHRNIWQTDQAQMMKDYGYPLVSIAHGRKEFFKHHTSEKAQWTIIQNKLRLSTDWPESKVIPRRGISTIGAGSSADAIYPVTKNTPSKDGG
jgi:hypothetical protein